MSDVLDNGVPIPLRRIDERLGRHASGMCEIKERLGVFETWPIVPAGWSAAPRALFAEAGIATQS
jgi:hypothetical protein